MTILLAFAFAASEAKQPAPSAGAAHAPLWSYNGSWQITSMNQKAGTKADNLDNQCASIGKYFTCQQSLDGAVTELLVLLPANAVGKYYTQSVMPDGRAGGRGDLLIEGDKWTFTSTWDQGGKTTYYKTVNVFTGKNKIHFEQQESTNNRDWNTTNSGDEVRSGRGK